MPVPLPRCWTCAARLPLELVGRPRPQCGRCLREAPPLDRTVAALDYRFPWDGLLQHFKYHQALDLRESLLERLNSALSAAEVDAPDWLLPVPMSSESLRERGYNQSHELAKALARRRGLRCEPDLLLRLRHNERQARLTLEQRAANVRGVFAVEPLRAARLRGLQRRTAGRRDDQRRHAVRAGWRAAAGRRHERAGLGHRAHAGARR